MTDPDRLSQSPDHSHCCDDQDLQPGKSGQIEAPDRSGSRSGGGDRPKVGQDSAVGVIRYASLGLELAAGALVFGGLGYWLDGYRQHERPYLGLVGVLFGFSLGMYRLILVAIRSADDS